MVKTALPLPILAKNWPHCRKSERKTGSDFLPNPKADRPKITIFRTYLELLDIKDLFRTIILRIRQELIIQQLLSIMKVNLRLD